MDNPWANAWEEPSKQPFNTQKSSLSTTLSTTINDQETDIGLPAWSTGAGINWTDSAEDSHHVSLWSSETENVKGWGPSSYDGIPLGRTSAVEQDPELDEDDAQLQPKTETETPHLVTPPSNVLSIDAVADASISSFQRLVSASPSPPPVFASELPVSEVLPSDETVQDQDEFGTFEAGFDAQEDTDPWTPAAPTWDSAWGSSGDTDRDIQVGHGRSDAPVDEWEEARRRKERQDKQVPPELLASILHQFEELLHDLWPNNSSELTSQDDFQNDRHNGMESAKELIVSATQRLIPSLTLPALPPFQNTFTHKHLTEAIRLTRHLAPTQQSPMAIYLANKGSAAWEASVRARKDINTENLKKAEGEFASGGLGWRVLGKDERDDVESWKATKEGNKTKKGSWFWSRKDNISESSTTDTLTKVGSGTESPSQRSSKTISQSSKSSMDSVRSSAAATATTNPSTIVTTPTATLSTASLPPAISPSASTPVASSSTSNTTSTTPTTPQSISTPPVSPPPPPAPSAVSRFFNRFSRTKSSLSANNTKNSLALSSDDLQFLGDISTVPNAGGKDSLDNDDFGLSGGLLKKPSPAVPEKLPPPLAPPPKPATLPSAPSALPPSLSRQQHTQRDSIDSFSSDALSFLGSEPSSKRTSRSEMKSPTLLPAFEQVPPPSSGTAQGLDLLDNFGSTPSHAIDGLNSSGLIPTIVSAENESSLELFVNTHATPVGKTSISARPGSLASAKTARPFQSSRTSSVPRGNSTTQPKKPTVTAIMSSSPSTSQPSWAEVISLPPPPSSRRETPIPVLAPPTSSTSSSRSASRSGTPPIQKPLPPPVPMQQSPTSVLGDTEDEFSEFHSSPVATTNSPSNLDFALQTPPRRDHRPSSLALHDSSFSSSYTASSDQRLFTSSQSKANGSADLFDDFDDFVSSSPALQTPSPPKPPTKSSPLSTTISSPQYVHMPSPLAPPKSSTTTSSPSPVPSTPPPPVLQLQSQQAPQQAVSALAKRRASRAADHTRTMSLLETAAARPGVWPAPRSPIPEAIAPPPDASARPMGYLSDSRSMGEMGGTQTKTLPASVSSPALFGASSISPPTRMDAASPIPQALRSRPMSPSSGGSQMRMPALKEVPLGDFGSASPSYPPAGSSGKSGPKGLSAQDLSFFESL